MAPKLGRSNETCTKRETWQLRLNLDQNNGLIHIYLKFYILGTIETLGDFWGQNGAKIRTQQRNMHKK